MADCFSRTLTPSATTVTEGTAVTFTVTPGTVSATAQTLSYQVTGAATTSGSVAAATSADFSVITGTVTVAANATSATFTVTPTSDSVVESFEGFKVTLLDSSFNSVASSSTVVINDPSSNSTPTAGSTFTLTGSGDTFSPESTTAAFKTTAGDDIFRAPSDNYLLSEDYVDGGAGTDVLTASITAAGQTIAPMLKNIEDITLTITAVDQQKTTFNAADFTGANTVTIKNAGAHSSTAAANADEVITVSNLAKTTTLGIVGGTASAANTGSSIVATFASAAAADTQNVAISSLGKTAFLKLSTAETVNITATGTGTTGANTIGSLTATEVKTLNLKGAGDLTISASDLAAAPTINATAATGVIAFTGETAATTTIFNGGTGATTVTSASTGIIKVTTGAGADTVNISGSANTATISTGAGNDTVKVGAQSNITALDSIVGGDGTDTLIITDTTIGSTTKTTLALGVSGFEILGVDNNGAIGINFNELSTYDTVKLVTDTTLSAGGGATSATTGDNGLDAITVTIENTDTLLIAADITAAAGAATTSKAGGIGGDALTFTPKLDNGANVVNLTLYGDADIVGGAGGNGTGAGSVGGVSGAAVDAVTTEIFNIKLQGTQSTSDADNVRFAAGSPGLESTNGTASASADTITVNSNATINVTDELVGTATKYNNLDLGTVAGSNVTVNASTFHGTLKVAVKATGAGNVALTGGSGADTLTGGTGQDQITGGVGADSITGGAGADVLSGGAGRDAFTIATAGHSGTTTYDAISDFGKVTVAATAAQVFAMTDVSGFQATATAAGGDNADMLDLAATATIPAVAAGTNVSSAVTTNPVVTGSISAKGIVTVAGAGASLVDTLPEWVAVAKVMTTATTANTAAFEFGGSTYVYQEGTTDDLVELTGVTGVTGIVVVGSSVAAVAGDIFVI